MGEVYRARDTRLGRDVALKILPEAFAADADRLHRFEQEARAVAALNHPNILAIFDVGQHNGSPFLVSELLEGDTLRALLDRGPASQRKAIDYGVQIAQGLSAAHDKGIVHRDLKPENLFLTKDGRVKILDFGLAKLIEKASASAAEPGGVTRTSSHTAAGVAMGTASYMAPEQVRGERSDSRTDIFAFGAVLFEMLSGRRTFRHDTPAETMTAVLREDPAEFSALGHPVSPALERTIRRCLEKDPEQRFQSARDLSFALGTLSGTESAGAARVIEPRRKVSHRAWLSVVIAMAAAAALGWYIARRPAPVTRMQFALPVPGEVSHLALSQDGSMLAFVSPEENSAVPMLYVQRIGSPDATLLQGTQGATYPFWSPDGRTVGFFANGKLQKISISGGTPQTLANVLAARGGSWSHKNVIIYAPDAGGPLWRVNADGTGAAPLTREMLTKEEDTHRWPLFLPDGDHFLFWAGNFSNIKDDPVSGIYMSSLAAKGKKLLVLCRSSFGFDSRNLYYADDHQQLVSLAFDVSKASVSGGTHPVANIVGFQPSTFWAELTVAQNGTVIYNSGTGAALSALTWMDRSGKELGTVGDLSIMANPSISPDGNRIAVDISDQKTSNIDVWIESVQGKSNARFTFDPAEEVAGVWSRSGSLVAYRLNRGRGPSLMVKPASGLGREKQVLSIANSEDIIPNSWIPGDQEILATHYNSSGSLLELVPLNGGNAIPFLSVQAGVSDGQVSPNGKWVAYTSNESGSWEVYVTTFPAAAGKWQVSRGGGTEPRWRGDGSEIFYINTTGVLTSVLVDAQGGFSTAAPVPLFQVRGRAPISSTDVFTYDVAKDGNRFLVNRYMRPAHTPPLIILLNANAKPE